MKSPRFSDRLTTVSRYIMALLFIFSGITKSLNPFGLSLQLADYFAAMGLDFLRPLAELGSILLPSVELLLGLMLLTGVSRKLSAWGTMIFMAFFSGLTLWIAIANPVSDCGCFGDVLKLSNWATFAKNLILLPFAIILLVNRNSLGRDNSALIYLAIVPLSLIVSLYSTWSLPMVDATPYKIGVNIPQAMQSPYGSSPSGQTILIYKEIATGEIHEFQVDDTTWYDSSRWEFVDSRLIDDRTTTSGRANQPAITGLPMLSPGGDLSGEILSAPGYTLIVVQTKLRELAAGQTAALEEMASVVRGQGGRAILLTSSPLPSSLNSVRALQEAGFEILGSDYSTLNTVIQNKYGGAMLLKDGTIIGKWSVNQLPRADDVLTP